jgi:hypothetical protein
MPRSSSEALDQGYFEIATLRAREGNQEYTLPADIDLSAYESAIIWCERFSVVMSSAELMPE